MARKNFTLNHTRIKREVVIIDCQPDDFNHMSVVIDFSYTLIADYFQTADEIIYGLYVDRQFVKEFIEEKVKVQLDDLNVNHLVEIYVHPHAGFRHTMNLLKPGNKIYVRFKARNPDRKYIKKHRVYWDNATGVYLTKTMGEIDSRTGVVSGGKIQSGGTL